MNSKPKMLLIRPYLKHVATYLHHYLFTNIESGLSCFFEVTVLSYDYKNIVNLNKYDVDIICVQLSPELMPLPDAMDFSEVNATKIILSASDAYSPAAYSIFDFAYAIAADAIFTLDVACSYVSKYGFDDRFYLYLWFVDTEVYKYYEQKKDVKYLKLGHSNSSYPWRKKMFFEIEQHEKAEQIIYPSLNPQPIMTNEYSKWINRTKYTLSCGGFTHTIVNKHLEIPASRSVLITQETEVVKAIGFIDGVNCVFCNSYNELCEKIKPLENDLELYNKIADNGYEFVRTNHTKEKRKVIIQWYNYFIENQQKLIRQPYLIGDLEIESTHKIGNFFIYNSGDTLLLQEFDLFLLQRNLVEARNIVDKLLSEFLPYSSTFLLRGVLVDLLVGDIKQAFEKFNLMLQAALLKSNAERPEPLLWSVFLWTLIKTEDKKNLILFSSYYTYAGYRFFDFTMLLVNHYLYNDKLINFWREKLSHTNYHFYSIHKFLNLDDIELKKLAFDITGIRIDLIFDATGFETENVLTTEKRVPSSRKIKLKKSYTILDFLMLRIADTNKKKLRTYSGITKRKIEILIGQKF